MMMMKCKFAIIKANYIFFTSFARLEKSKPLISIIIIADLAKTSLIVHRPM